MLLQRLILALSGADTHRALHALFACTLIPLLVRLDNIDLLITDLTMPELTGEQLAAMALKLKPSLPVIVLTGFSEHITSQIAIHHIVSKPFNLQDMAWLIRKTLDTK